MCTSFSILISSSCEKCFPSRFFVNDPQKWKSIDAGSEWWMDRTFPSFFGEVVGSFLEHTGNSSFSGPWDSREDQHFSRDESEGMPVGENFPLELNLLSCAKCVQL